MDKQDVTSKPSKKTKRCCHKKHKGNNNQLSHISYKDTFTSKGFIKTFLIYFIQCYRFNKFKFEFNTKYKSAYTKKFKYVHRS